MGTSESMHVLSPTKTWEILVDPWLKGSKEVSVDFTSLTRGYIIALGALPPSIACARGMHVVSTVAKAIQVRGKKITWYLKNFILFYLIWRLGEHGVC